MRNMSLPIAIRRALIGGAALALAAPTVVLAQDDAEAKAEKLETIEVVGSRIKRTDIETSQPIFVVDKTDLERTGLSQIGDILQHLTSVGAGLNQVFNNGGNGGTFVDLRELGAQRTLILVNGRRYAPDGQALSGTVDLNSIPTSIVERIEVLKDGASSVYGSDAIAGVINIITVKTFDGLSTSAFISENEEGDGRTEQYDFTAGASTDRASIVINVSYNKNEPIWAGDRSISAVPQFGADFCASSTSPQGRFGFVGRSGTFTVDGTTAPGVVQSATAFRTFVIPADCYNFAPDNYLLTPQERYAAYAQTRYSITDNITFRAEFVYNNRTSDQTLAAIPVTFAGSGLFGSNVAFDVAANSYYNPLGVATNRVQRRVNETGGRIFNQDVDVWHFAGGLEGNFDLAERNFSWDMGYTFSQNQVNNLTTGQVDVRKIELGVGPSFRDAGTGQILCGTPGNVIVGCVPINVFGGNGSLTPEMINYITVPLQDKFEYKRIGYTANITGNLFDLPAGPLAFAAGYEYRNESGFDQPDAITINGGSSGNIRLPTAGGFTVDEFYAEFSVPLLSDIPGAELLELSLATRYSDYNTFGDTTNSKIGFRWKPFSELLVRGNWSEGFRAPSIAELFTGQSDNFPTFSDPCVGPGQAVDENFSTLTAAQQAACLAAGVPAGGSDQANGQIQTTVGGNENLAPEQATTKTLGLVYSPEWVEGLDLSLDWYRISITDVIIPVLGAQVIANACILGGAADQCALITRLPAAGGAISNVLDLSLNGGSRLVEGWDLTANYRFDTQFGRFVLSSDTAYTSKDILKIPSGLAAPDDQLVFSQVGNYGGRGQLGARMKSNFSVNWEYGDWGATWGVRYIQGVQEDCSAAVDPATQCSSQESPFNVDGLDINGLELVPTNQLDDRFYNDLQVRWSTPWNGQISGGVRNILDEDPPVSISTFANSFDPSYDVPGRFWYVRYTQRF